MKMRILARLLIVLSFCFLGACSQYKMPYGALVNYGSSCSKLAQAHLIGQLDDREVHVSFLGDNIILNMPLKTVFSSGASCEDQPYNAVMSNNTLDMIAKFLRCYQKISVRVIVYTNYSYTAQKNIKCAKVWAQNIANYLWKKQIDTRFLYYDGLNGAKMAYSILGENRIEIMARRLP